MIGEIFGLMLFLCVFALLVLIIVMIYDEIQDIKRRKKGEKK